MVKKILSILVFFLSFVGPLWADSVVNGGRITFTGTVLDTPCTIDPTSIDMNVNLGQTTTKYLSEYGFSTPVNINIKLTNCSLSGAGTSGADVTKASVTFDSSAVDINDANLLANTNSAGANGVGVRLLTSDDVPVTLGSANAVPLQVRSTEQTLTFHARIEAVNGVAPTAGSVAANATYIIAYL